MTHSYDFIALGGGAAGFFAAITAAESNPTLKILIVEKNREVLEKVRISGGGRCNVTHACFIPKDLVKFYPRGHKELVGPFHKFAPGDTMAWFESRGVPLKIEDDNRVFPQSDSSESIANCLIGSAKKGGVEIVTTTKIEHISEIEGGWRLTSQRGEVFQTQNLLVAAGSHTPTWNLLNGLGLKLVEPCPSLFTFEIKDERLFELQGISLENTHVQITSLSGKFEGQGPLLITHRGLSGPGILKLSAWAARELAEVGYKFKIKVNFRGFYNPQETIEELNELKLEKSKQNILTTGQMGIPQRLWAKLCLAAGIKADKRWADMSKGEINGLATQLCAATFDVLGKNTNKDEFVTAGGVDLSEIDFKAFCSKKYPNLYLAGEVLNIDALTGGFNFQAAWTGGYLVGKAVAGE